ncbi:MAG: hypothetical protein HYZ68_03890 [Chloroflexi bacterium]|nr:hypothetical protein [Chloroflexota bacterium]
MGVFISFIDQVAFLIYAAGLLGALFLLLRFVAAQREVARAQRWAERESASARAYRYGFLALGLLLLIALVVLVDTRLAPLLSELSVDIPPGLPTGLTTAPRATEPTPTPTMEHLVVEVAPAQPTPALQESPAPPAHCPTPGARITSPSAGATLSGEVEIRGSAQIPDFQFYKLEFAAGPDPNPWAYLGGGDEPVVEGVLWSWDTRALPSGTYLLRLTVVDHSGNFSSPCDVPITLAG